MRVQGVATVQIGSSSRGLLLAWVPLATATDQVNATLVDDGLSASRPVYHGYASGFRDLVLFFEEMERDWRGWDGARSWESLEGDLRIEAQHAYGHIELIPGRSGPNWSNLPVAEGAHVVPTTIGPMLTFAESRGVRTCPRNTPVARLPARSC